MPRLPVDGKKVQEIRFTLGTFERERLDTLITAISINRIANPVVALMSDVSGMIVLGSLLATIGIIVDFGGLPVEPTMDQVTDRIKEAIQNRQDLRANITAEERERLRAGGDQSLAGGLEQLIRNVFSTIFNPPDVEFNP
jgi:hypothetical protein